MNIIECIKQLESLKDHCVSVVDEQDPEDIWRYDVEALQFALEALRAQQEREKNEPLTLEELREMHGLPIWVVNLGTLKKNFRDEWALNNVANKRAESIYTIYRPEHYGKTWLAYRRRPEPVSTVNTDCKPKTNADRIRAMSDKDMIDLFIGNPVCAERFWLPSCDATVECEKCVADWLQQPAEEGGGTEGTAPDAENIC